MAAKPSFLHSINELSIDNFLQEYWQQQPLFAPGALRDWQSPLDTSELAGLTLEDSVESRLIIENRSALANVDQWQLEHGPFSEERFGRLPESHFTFLIQSLDQICPQIHNLLNSFRFLPNWRLDDVMASIASKGGSVGPHFDHYDVFLIQGAGTRQWHLGQTCDGKTSLVPECPLKIVEDFEITQTFETQPGDMLYIPARVAHWGIATSDDCITYSVGFRASSYADMLMDLSADIAAQIPAEYRYSDPMPTMARGDGQYNPGLIGDDVIETIMQNCRDLITPERVKSWLGVHLTQAKREPPAVMTHEYESPGIQLQPHVRASYCKHQEFPELADIFIDGECWQTSLALAEAICSYTQVRLDEYDENDRGLIETWIQDGYLSPETSDACADY